MRTRFAPSPTGALHIGGLRTALFAWLIAKQSKDSFTLRIEDTDKAREVEDAAQEIVKILDFVGLTPDEGLTMSDQKILERGNYGPYHQSARLPIYKEHADLLLKNGHAYRCFCTPERLDSMRKDQEKMKQPQMYDRLCHTLKTDDVERRVKSGEKHVIRMLVPRDKIITIKDEIYGHLTFRGHTVDDQVLIKSDGFPTYHLAHVVDDHLMKMDLVIRGEEWLSSLPKHLILFGMFDWQPPKYGHVPLLLNKDRSKLSKRQNDVAAMDYIVKGYLSDALINFLALLGWNPGTTQDIFSKEDLISQFSLKRVQKSGAIFDLEKLNWLQGQWMRRMEPQKFASCIHSFVIHKFPEAEKDPKFFEKAKLAQERIVFFQEAPEHMGFFYKAPEVNADLIVNEKQKVTFNVIKPILELLYQLLDEKVNEKDWHYENIRNALDEYATYNHSWMKKLAENAIDFTNGRKVEEMPPFEPSPLTKGQVLWTLRYALTGSKFSPGAYEVAAALGKNETLKRLSAVKF